MVQQDVDQEQANKKTFLSAATLSYIGAAVLATILGVAAYVMHKFDKPIDLIVMYDRSKSAINTTLKEKSYPEVAIKSCKDAFKRDLKKGDSVTIASFTADTVTFLGTKTYENKADRKSIKTTCEDIFSSADENEIPGTSLLTPLNQAEDRFLQADRRSIPGALIIFVDAAEPVAQKAEKIADIQAKVSELSPKNVAIGFVVNDSKLSAEFSNAFRGVIGVSICGLHDYSRCVETVVKNARNLNK